MWKSIRVLSLVKVRLKEEQEFGIRCTIQDVLVERPGNELHLVVDGHVGNV